MFTALVEEFLWKKKMNMKRWNRISVKSGKMEMINDGGSSDQLKLLAASSVCVFVCIRRHMHSK